jgi:dTDP-4-amino-4,6-dideoxygalactose transaminase
MATQLRSNRSGNNASPSHARVTSRWPIYAADEIAAVVNVLQSGQVNALHHCNWCPAFEAGFADLCGMPHAISLANGTLALELALRALGIGPGDEVIIPARSFMATASCVVTVGAIPVFADVDETTQGLNAETIAAVLTERTRAIIVVHLGGHPVPMKEIVGLALQCGIKVIEDCAQAHGATVDGRSVGGFGDAGTFSFCTDKIMSTGGEGGMLVMRDEAAWRRAWSYKDHGKALCMLGGPGGSEFRWLHQGFGSNYRLTEMQAAIGVTQLAKLHDWIDQRRRNADALLGELVDLNGLRLVMPAENIGHAYYKLYVFVRPDVLRHGWSRRRIVEEAQSQGVPCQTGSCPEIYREQAFAGTGWRPTERLPVARRLGETSIMFPVDPSLDEEQCRSMGRTMRGIVERASLHVER